MRKFKQGKAYEDTAEMKAFMLQLQKDGVTIIGGVGSKLPDGKFKCTIAGYQHIEGKDDETGEKLAIVLYKVKVEVNGAVINDTTLCNETPEQLLPIGAERTIEPFTDAKNRRLNRFVVDAVVPALPEGALTEANR